MSFQSSLVALSGVCPAIVIEPGGPGQPQHWLLLRRCPWECTSSPAQVSALPARALLSKAEGNRTQGCSLHPTPRPSAVGIGRPLEPLPTEKDSLTGTQMLKEAEHMLIFLLTCINLVTVLLDASHDDQIKPTVGGVLGGQHPGVTVSEPWECDLPALPLFSHLFLPHPNTSCARSNLRMVPESLRTSFISLGCQFL